MRKPEEFFKFYRDKMLCDTAKPNAAHLKLAEMEQTGKLKAVITQNIDNLHQMAGSKNGPGAPRKRLPKSLCEMREIL